MKQQNEYIFTGVLILILLFAAGTRLYQIGELSLGNDDLSAITRAQVDTFSDLIEQGVKEDVHPAGVQVMLWAWIKLFGQEEWVLRIPFLLAGLLSVALIYRLGNLLINESAGLLAAGIFATTEYGIYHSLSVRPYIIGVCSLLLLAIHLISLSREQTGSVRRICFLSFTGAICAYVHYFAALVAVVMILSSAMLMKRSERKALWISVAGMAVLYLPHLGIFLAHAGAGGSAWMGVPGQNFFVRLGGYLLHYSWWFGGTVFLVLIWRVVRGGIEKANAAVRWVLADWVLLPLLFGVGYSWLIAPIVHFGVLVFLYPFFLLLIFSFTREIPAIESGLQVLGLMMVAVVSLFTSRGFYDWNYRSGAEYIASAYADHFDQTKSGWMNINHPYYFRYYAGDSLAASIEGYDLPAVEDFLTWADTTTAERVAIGWLSKNTYLTLLPAIQRYFPYRTQEFHWPISEYYEFSRVDANPSIPDSRTLAVVTEASWDSTAEFVGTIEVIPFDYFTEYPEILSVELDAIIPSSKSAIPSLVMSIEVNGQPTFWKSLPLIPVPGQHDRYIADHVFRTRNLPSLNNSMAILKAYLWNPGGASGSIDRLAIRRRSGNPDLYAFVEPVR